MSGVNLQKLSRISLAALTALFQLISSNSNASVCGPPDDLPPPCHQCGTIESGCGNALLKASEIQMEKQGKHVNDWSRLYFILQVTSKDGPMGSSCEMIHQTFFKGFVQESTSEPFVGRYDETLNQKCIQTIQACEFYKIAALEKNSPAPRTLAAESLPKLAESIAKEDSVLEKKSKIAFSTDHEDQPRSKRRRLERRSRPDREYRRDYRRSIFSQSQSYSPSPFLPTYYGGFGSSFRIPFHQNGNGQFSQFNAWSMPQPLHAYSSFPQYHQYPMFQHPNFPSSQLTYSSFAGSGRAFIPGYYYPQQQLPLFTGF